MIPLKDENPSKTIPFVNIFLVLVNISVFLYQNFLMPGGASAQFYRLGCIPYEFTHFVDIDPRAPIPVPFTILTAMFMHAGWIHLLSNMLFLWVFGDNVEDRVGHLRYLFFYIMCGISATLFHIFTNLNSQVPLVGASGAIAGVMGAYMFLFPKARIRTLIIWFIFIQMARIPAFVILGYWILIQVLSGFVESGSGTGSGVAWFAHIGGFVTGFILILSMRKRGRKSHRRR